MASQSSKSLSNNLPDSIRTKYTGGQPKFSFLMILIQALIILFLSEHHAAAVQGTLPGKGDMDLLHLPALKSDRAPFSLLMDVVQVKRKSGASGKTDDRIVAAGERGYIIYSDDLGKTWKQADVPVSVTLTALFFTDEKMGWATGHDGVVLHTEDGGASWIMQLEGSRINELIPERLEKLIKDCRDELAGFDLNTDKNSGQDNVGRDEADQGKKDELEQKLEKLQLLMDDSGLAKEDGPSRPLFDLWFKNEREGVVVGSFGMILKTEDGGRNWTPVVESLDNPDGFHYYSITEAGGSLYIAGEAGMIFRSDDSGISWKKLISPYEGSFFGITGNSDGSDVVVFGLRGSLYHSADRGETWIQSEKAKGASISDGLFLTNGELCMACVDGSLIVSRDGGRTFTPTTKSLPGSISITELNDGTVIVAGVRGISRVREKHGAL